MKKLVLLIALLVVGGAMAAKCGFKPTNIKVGTVPGCLDGTNPDSAKIYIHENFYICGELPVNTGTLTSYNKPLSHKETIQLSNNSFSIKVEANTEKHQVYYISLNYSGPENNSCKLTDVPIEILDKCDIVAPASKINEGDSIEEGKNFTIEVDNPDRDYNLTIFGLSNTTIASLTKGANWMASFPSDKCCKTPTCSCQLKLNFVDSKHAICHDTATLDITIKKKESERTEGVGGVITAVIAGIIIIGTGIILLINKRS
ncbi:MAG: hypothetical protein J7L23_04275 [Candidatus Diapherotrites archaeon]|nr:hypothetical protein [Candidatus Diapherotrites archaeon]